ncbi:MAG TPA: tetratricopeptide repeat protein [Geobacterales bacterium]|nr:tetratricopeptide repeat protein [Geobacterales bacterium]
MINPEAERLYEEGVRAVASGNTLVALVHLEKAALLTQSPVICSYLGYCLAKERGGVRKGMALCQEAIKAEPRNSVHYLNLGRVLIVAGRKREAIDTFRLGLKQGKNREITRELERLGTRREPVLSFLERESLLNRFLGRMFARLGLR